MEDGAHREPGSGDSTPVCMSKQIYEQISKSTCHVALRIDVFIRTTRRDFRMKFYSLYCIQRVRPWILLHMHSLFACPLRVFLKFVG